MTSILRKIDLKWFIVAAILSIYPAFVLGYVWYHCYISEFRGGENGQLDAYRHSLASAVVAYTLSPVAVEIFTAITEFPDGAAYEMDRHNNYIGKTIGSQANSLDEINNLITKTVQNGAKNATNPKQITWLDESTWGTYWLW